MMFPKYGCDHLSMVAKAIIKCEQDANFIQRPAALSKIIWRNELAMLLKEPDMLFKHCPINECAITLSRYTMVQKNDRPAGRYRSYEREPPPNHEYRFYDLLGHLRIRLALR